MCPVCATPRLPDAVVCAQCGEVLVTAANDPLVGQQLGAYRVVRRLGVGGMGAVYEALEVNIERRAALKVIHPHLRDDEQLASLLAEARAVNAIGDAGIVDIYASGSLPDGRSYLVMELLEGETLQARLLREKRLPLAVALDLLIDLSRSLEAAHAAGFVHRDLKAANVFIVERTNRPPFPKLLDFGIVHRVKSGGGTALGTPSYAPPEQVTHTNVGPKADLYALGVLAFEMLTGHLPFDAPDGYEVLRLHREAARPSVRAEVEVPEALDVLVRSLMATEPAHRPASAGEVRTRLVAVKASLQVPVVAAVSPRPRGRGALVAGAIALVAVVAVAGVALREKTQVTQTPPVAPRDPMADAQDQALRELRGKSALEAVDGLLAARAAFGATSSVNAETARLTAELRTEAQTQLAADELEGARKRLTALGKLTTLAPDDALLSAVNRAVFARDNAMVRVGDVYVDRYEYPNRAGAMPATRVDFEDAVKLCAGAGKHLCTEGEWETACEKTAFPARTCVTKESKAKGPAASGARAKCVTKSGVFDLAGNVTEWTASAPREGAPQRVIRGGSFKQSAAQSGCGARDYLLPGLGGGPQLGLRCCL